MSLTIHHMQISQSERLVWLCEELEIPYKLVLHHRDPIFSPQSIKDLNPLGQAPVIQDGDLTLAETAACVQYIIHVHGGGRLTLAPDHPNYADYLYWFHLSSGNLQPVTLLMLLLPKVDEAQGTYKNQEERLDTILQLMDAHLSKNAWLAGDTFTCADIMIVYSLTTMRVFLPTDLSKYTSILSYLKRIVERDGYKRARAKADPLLELMIDGPPPVPFAKRMNASL